MDRKINAAAESGEPITVITRGNAKLRGALKGSFKIVGDIVRPIVGDWDEDREWRNIAGQFDDASNRHTHAPVLDGGLGKARKARGPGPQSRPRGK